MTEALFLAIALGERHMLRTRQEYVRAGGFAAVLSALVLIASSCGPDASSPVSPDAQFARGGNGKKGGSAEVTEYWVYNGNMIHVAGTGSVSDVNARVSFDHFFNGGRDDNESDHFEYGFPGPAKTATTSSGGVWHVDIPFNGERGAEPYVTGPFTDAVVTNIGDGADPYVFTLRLFSGDNSVAALDPQNVIGGGGEGGDEENVKSAAHGSQSVKSYASFNGAPATGEVTITSLTSSATCTTVQGKGRGRNSGSTMTLSVDYAVELDGFTVPDGNVSGVIWIERHLVIDGVRGDRVANESQTLSVSGTLSASVSDEPHTVAVVVDYVYPVNAFSDYVYAPGGPVSTEVNDGNVTVVASATENVSCS